MLWLYGTDTDMASQTLVPILVEDLPHWKTFRIKRMASTSWHTLWLVDLMPLIISLAQYHISYTTLDNGTDNF